MKAFERTLQQILHSADQYIIPLFQRFYIWRNDNWDMLWDDLKSLFEATDKRRHFLGSIVCVPEPSYPGIVPGYQVIDGQQRLMTLSIILCATREAAKDRDWPELAAEIEEDYLIHKFKKGRERYKIFPRLRDRSTYTDLIDRKSTTDGQVSLAFAYFAKNLEKDGLIQEENNLRKFFELLTTQLDFVLITLEGENPYKIFKSLNSTGVDLEECDLIRNHVFMSLDITSQDDFDDNEWSPLEKHFDENGKLDSKRFSAFFRDVLLGEGKYIGTDQIFESFEYRYPLEKMNPIEVVASMRYHAKHYDMIDSKIHHSNKDINSALNSIRNLNVSTSYPLILLLLEAADRTIINEAELFTALKSIASFVLRRFVCGDSSRAYGRWFCSACKELGGSPLRNLIKFLEERGWPDDNIFIPRFQSMNLYNSKYDNAILKELEMNLQAPSEPVGLDKCWIEHVMPQTIVEDDDGRAWISMLKGDWRRIHGECLHTPGNLTLVGYDYNIGMQKKPFESKKPILARSRVYLNKVFEDPNLNNWNEDAIKTRGLNLAKLAAIVWPRLV